jgi:hypothetical protein
MRKIILEITKEDDEELADKLEEIAEEIRMEVEVGPGWEIVDIDNEDE